MSLIIKITGGLGNQMFQYATGVAVAAHLNTDLKLDTSHYAQPLNNTDTERTYDLHLFEITHPVATLGEIRAVKYPLGFLSQLLRFINKKIFRRLFLDYHPEIFKHASVHTYLDGYFQSEKNFLTLRPQLLKMFALQKKYITTDVSTFEHLIHQHEAISLHIRRGDYIANPTTHAYHGTCPISYYRDAIQYLTTKVPNPHFFIFSDDIAWVKENLQIPFPHTYVSGNNLIPAQEMYLMSKCKHNIIANSTFSWWGAWLNQNPNKIVIAPKKWTNKVPDPHPNIVPETWIRM